MDKLSEIIARIVSEAMRAESYDNEPYMAALNQFAHYMLGVYATVAVCVTFAVVSGEMPYKTEVFFVLSAFYLGVIEIWKQGWRGRDTIIDSTFFSLGVASPLVSVSELSIGPPIMLGLNPFWSFFVMLMLPVLLLAHVWRRA